ncbi:hypothetical protein ABPG74_000036 [Tetrahymena malaccensis]
MQNLDIFGSQILFCFQKEKKYQTRIGGFITLGIITIITIRFFIIWLEVFQRTNPNVIQKERQVYSPQKFVFDKTNTQFAFGMQDPVQYNQYIDPEIYTISVTQYTQTTVNDPTTGQPISNYTQRQIKSGICSSQNFQNPSTQNHFQSLNYQNLYCIDPDEQIVLEGDYGQPSFNYAVITVSQCVTGCKSNATLDQYLKNGFFSMYYTDITVDPVIKDYPFVFFNRDLYWTTSSKNPQVLNMYFRNDYVESDFGWITSDIQTVRYPQYSTQDISSTQSSDYFFQVVIRFEKAKENLFQRKYQTLSDIISQIGGFAQTLIAFGFLLCSYFSEISLNNSIINEAFNFRIQNQSQKNNTQKLNNDQSFVPIQEQQIANQNSNKFEQKNIALFSVDKLMSENQDSKLINANLQQENTFQGNQGIEVNEKSCKINKQFQLKKQYTQNQIKLSQIIQKKTKNNFNVTNEQEKSIKQSENNSKKNNNEDAKKFENQVKKMLNEETNSMQISFFEYLKLHLWPFSKEVRNKKKIIDYSVNKLYYHIDLLNVIKKLIEVDKLKRILMDDDQIKLFEYLPKPSISDQDILNEEQHSEKQNDNNFKDIFYQDTRSESQKLQDAYEAYIKISKRDHLNILDKKIIDNIDKNLVNIFKIAEENSLQAQEENQKVINQSIFAQTKQIIEINQMISQKNISQTPMLQSNGEINNNNQSRNEQQKTNEKQVNRKQLLGANDNSQQEIESDFQIPEDHESQTKHDLNLNSMYFSNAKAQFQSQNK